MFCTRCRHFEAAPEGVLCAHCAAAQPLAPAATPHGPAWLRSPVGLGRAVAVLLGVVVAADLFALGTGVLLYGVWGDIVAGDVGQAVLDRADVVEPLYGVAGVLQTVALLATAVVFLVWFHRARVNAEVFDPFGHRMKRGWAVGGWFVPVVHFWFPRRIALDVWDASSPWNAPRPHGLVNAWWALWLVSTALTQAGNRMYSRAESPSEVQRAVGQTLFSDAVDIAAAVLAAVFVLTLTRMQDRKARSGPGMPVTATPVAG